MRTLSFPAALLLATGYLSAQNPTIDLNLWTEEHFNGTGPWVLDAPRLNAYSTNTVNTDCSVLYSDFNVNFLEFRMTVNPGAGDDDLIGFVLGWDPGETTSQTADYVVVDWKRTTQSYQNWGTANAGLALSHVTGPVSAGYGGGPIDLWSHTGSCTELVRGNKYGQTGWEFGTPYYFRVLYLKGNPGTVDVWIDGQIELHATGVFGDGHFGAYNYSQPGTLFQFPLKGSFTPFGNGCAGSAGTPYLFSPKEPLLGASLPIVMANLPASGMPVLLLGVSNTRWQGLPLPLDLSPLGAPGCSIYTSSELSLPMQNFNGTGYMELQIPSSAIPGTRPAFFTQGLTLDPGANRLGIVLSNGAALAIGVR